MLEPVATAGAGIRGRRFVAVELVVDVVEGDHRGIGGHQLDAALRLVSSSSLVLVLVVLELVVILVVVVVELLVLFDHLSEFDLTGFLVVVVVLDAVLVGLDPLQIADQRGQLPGQRVHLVTSQRGARRELRLGLREHSLQPQHERVVASPFKARIQRADVDLLEGGIERGSTHRARRKCDGGILTIVQKRLATPCSCGFGGRFKVSLEAKCHVVWCGCGLFGRRPSATPAVETQSTVFSSSGRGQCRRHQQLRAVDADRAPRPPRPSRSTPRSVRAARPFLPPRSPGALRRPCPTASAAPRRSRPSAPRPPTQDPAPPTRLGARRAHA